MMCPLVVVDTNVLLDCFVFKDKAAINLHKALIGRNIRWVATQSMLNEFLRVLTYPKVVARVSTLEERDCLLLPDIFMQYADMIEEADICRFPQVQCRDPDDQIFIDTALSHDAILLSKDNEVLKLNGRKGLKAMSVDFFSLLLKEKQACI